MRRTPDRWSRLWRLHALWGAAAFAAVCVARPLTGLRAIGGIGYVLAFAALVIVPLAVSLAAQPRRDGSTARLYRLAAVTIRRRRSPESPPWSCRPARPRRRWLPCGCCRRCSWPASEHGAWLATA